MQVASFQQEPVASISSYFPDAVSLPFFGLRFLVRAQCGHVEPLADALVGERRSEIIVP